MTINSEPIYAELFAQARTVHAWASAQRRLRHPDDLKEVNMPALFQIQMTDTTTPDLESMQHGMKGISKDEISVKLMVFVHSGSGGEWPSSIINPILDALKAKFGYVQNGPGRESFNDLNGLVQYAVISGTIEFYENAKSSSLMAVVPIKILTFN